MGQEDKANGGQAVTPSETETGACGCGRGYTHCRVCGSRNVYVKRFRSLEVGVNVYGCRRCSSETRENMVCNAPSRTVPVTGFKPYQKEASPAELPPWGLTIPGTGEYLQTLNETAVQMTKKKGVTLVKAFVECKKQGWQLELYELGDEVKEALKNAGLYEEPQTPLDEIIKNMQENSK